MPGVTSVGALVESHGVDRMDYGTLSRGDKNKLAVHAVRKRLATLLPVSNVPRRTQQLCSLRRPPQLSRVQPEDAGLVVTRVCVARRRAFITCVYVTLSTA